MSPAARPIVVIAYKFPPYVGVGGFRWAKLSKYLARLDHEVHVVTVPWHAGTPNTAEQPSREPGVIVHPIRSGSPHRIRHRRPTGRWRAAGQDITLRALDSVLYYDDEAQRWGRHMVGFCERLAEERRIEVAIASGHPFQANRWAAELKRRRPALKLIQDFRDPWADNPFHPLPPRRAARVRRWQEEAIAAADAVVSVTPELLELFLRGSPSTRGEVISNGVDPESVGDVAAADLPMSGPVRLTHIGNVSNGRDRPLAALLDAIRELGADGPAIEVELVGGRLEWVARAHPDLVGRGALRIYPLVSQRDALRRVASSHYALQLTAREFPYAASTKIWEYALVGVPAISLNYGGFIDRIVRDCGFGHSLDLSRDPDLAALLRSLPDSAAADRDRRFAFDVEAFTHPALARDYSALIQSL